MRSRVVPGLALCGDSSIPLGRHLLTHGGLSFPIASQKRQSRLALCPQSLESLTGVLHHLGIMPHTIGHRLIGTIFGLCLTFGLALDRGRMNSDMHGRNFGDLPPGVAAMIHPILDLVPLQSCIDLVRPDASQMLDLRSPRLFGIEDTGFNSETGRRDHAGCGQDVRVMVPVVAFPARSMNRNIGRHAIPLHKFGRELSRHFFPRALIQFTRQRQFVFAGNGGIAPLLDTLCLVPEQVPVLRPVGPFWRQDELATIPALRR